MKAYLLYSLNLCAAEFQSVSNKRLKALICNFCELVNTRCDSMLNGNFKYDCITLRLHITTLCHGRSQQKTTSNDILIHDDHFFLP